MARHARIHAEGNWYHLFNRGARRWPIFQNDADRGAFVALLSQVNRDFSAEIHAFCLMDNHFHLVARFPKDDVSAAMARLGQVFTQQFNLHHDVDGPLFRGRFGSVPITDERQLLTEVRYVARNPLDIVGAQKLSDYRWSSHRSYLGLRRPPAWLRTDLVLRLLGGPASYRALVEAGRSDPVTLAEVLEEVRRLTGANLNELCEGGRGRTNEPRLLVVVAMAELAIMSLESLAEHLNYSSASSLRSAVRRGRALRRQDPGFDELYQLLLKRLE